jgi:hypothetical protein
MPIGYNVVCYGNVANTFGLRVNIGTPGAVATQTSTTVNVNVPGLLTTDQVEVSKPTIQAGLVVGSAVCLTNGVLTIQFLNVTVGSITPTAGELYIVEVNRYLDTLPSSIQ